jgi:hypothetical protein
VTGKKGAPTDECCIPENFLAPGPKANQMISTRDFDTCAHVYGLAGQGSNIVKKIIYVKRKSLTFIVVYCWTGGNEKPAASSDPKHNSPAPGEIRLGKE